MSEARLLQRGNALIARAMAEGKSLNPRLLSPSKRRRPEGLRLIEVRCMPTDEVYYGVRSDDERSMMARLRTPQGGYSSLIARAVVLRGADAFVVRII